MAETSAASVKALRDRTGAGMMDCKAALETSGGDLEKAIDFLRKKGMAQAAKRAGREAKEGLVVSRVSGSRAALAEINCETDFVARTEDFKNLASLALDETFKISGDASQSKAVTSVVETLSGKIGEKIVVRRTTLVDSRDGVLFGYIHSNNKLGIIVELCAGKADSNKSAAFAQLGKDLAMQVAAANPVAVDRAGVPAAQVEREQTIYKEEIKGKPENIIDKILQGKLSKFYQTVCLLEQPFIKDDKTSVQQLIAGVSKSLGDTVQVKRFVRYQLGESF